MSEQITVRPKQNFSNVVWRHILDQCVVVVRELLARISLRQSLADIKDRQLQDAGLIRHDVEVACSQELLLAAESEIMVAASQRVGNW